MKKIKRFKLAQSQYLSSDEMSKLDGGFELKKCNASNAGERCLYTSGDFMATGICYFKEYKLSDGNTTTTFSGYVCIPD